MPPIDWAQFSKAAANDAANAAAQTDDQLAGRIASVSRLSVDEVKALFPAKGDAANVAKLLAIVKGATSQNDKIAQLKANIDQLAGVMVTLIGHLAGP